jgi:hypothetical protein
MHTLLKMLLVGTMLVAGTAIAAGAASPFDGTWKVNLAKSKYVPEPPPKESSRTYTSAGDTISVVITGTRADGTAINVKSQFKLDGKDYAYTGSQDADTLSVTQTDPRTRVGTTKPKGKVASQSTLTVSADGKTLTLVSKGTNPKGEAVNNTVVMDRQ